MSNHWRHPPKKRAWLHRHAHTILDAILIGIILAIWIGFMIARGRLGL